MKEKMKVMVKKKGKLAIVVSCHEGFSSSFVCYIKG